MRQAFVQRLPPTAPDDVSGVEQARSRGARSTRGAIVAILGKTEGNGCVNDFTRAFAVRALRDLLARHVGPAGRPKVSLVMSGGTEGALAPHWIVLERAAGRLDGLAGRRSPSARRIRRTSPASISAGGSRR